MKRPRLVKVLVGSQLLIALGGLAIAIYLMWLTRSPDILKEKDAADTVRGLWIATGVIGVPSLLEAVFAIALWRRVRWAWWSGFVLNALLTGVFVYSLFDESNIDRDDVLLVIIPLVLCALYLALGVRRWFQKETPVATKAMA